MKIDIYVHRNFKKAIGFETWVYAATTTQSKTGKEAADKYAAKYNIPRKFVQASPTAK